MKAIQDTGNAQWPLQGTRRLMLRGTYGEGDKRSLARRGITLLASLSLCTACGGAAGVFGDLGGADQGELQEKGRGKAASVDATENGRASVGDQDESAPDNAFGDVAPELQDSRPTREDRWPINTGPLPEGCAKLEGEQIGLPGVVAQIGDVTVTIDSWTPKEEDEDEAEEVDDVGEADQAGDVDEVDDADAEESEDEMEFVGFTYSVSDGEVEGSIKAGLDVFPVVESTHWQHPAGLRGRDAKGISNIVFCVPGTDPEATDGAADGRSDADGEADTDGDGEGDTGGEDDVTDEDGDSGEVPSDGDAGGSDAEDPTSPDRVPIYYP